MSIPPPSLTLPRQPAPRPLALLAVLLGLLSTPGAWASALSLAWNPSTDATVTGYHLYYGLASDTYSPPINAGAATNITFQSLPAGTTFFFAVTAYDAQGDESSFSPEISYTVPSPPPIASQPLSQSVVAGLPAVFTVLAGGAGPLTYQWFRNGSPLSGATAPILTINNVADANAGAYTVQISNRTGTALSATATLTVIDPLHITSQPASRTNVAGSTATFTVQVSGTPLFCQWLKNGVVITGATATTLTLPAVSDSSAGSYTAMLGNAAGAVLTSPATLTVLDSPFITAQPLSYSANAGSAVTFAVTATGPSLSYQWFKSSAPISGATSSRLVLAAITDANAGYYSVIITNPSGSAVSASALLTVRDAPQITSQPASVFTLTGATALFNVTLTGAAPFTYHWIKNGTLLTDSARLSGSLTPTLTLTNLAAADSGSYWVTVSNVAGGVSSAVATLSANVPGTTNLPATSNLIASVVGPYNGLFYQTNTLQQPAIAEKNAGLLGNCLINPNLSYTARIYAAGAIYALSGALDPFGNATTVISRSPQNLSNLTLTLHLDWTFGAKQITGSISNMSLTDPWTSPLLADLATNQLQLPPANSTFLIPPGATGPANYGMVSTSLSAAGILTLTGTLGDGTLISQTVPISKNGDAPFYVSLYNNQGLIEGWVNVAQGAPTGSVTWIQPPGNGTPYPAGFTNVATLQPFGL